MNNSPSPAATSSKFKPILIGIAVALVLAAILYGVGLSQGRAQLGAQKTASDSQISGLQTQVDDGKKALESSQNATRLIQARASLLQTALDLERRNFGTANTHLQESVAMLGQIQGGEMDSARLSAIQAQIAKTDVNVAVDLEAQRRRVVDFARQLEALSPKMPQTAPVEATTEATTETPVEAPESAPAETP